MDPLALVARSFSAIGTLLVVRDPLRGSDTPVRVTEIVHTLIPNGERMRS